MLIIFTPEESSSQNSEKRELCSSLEDIITLEDFGILKNAIKRFALDTSQNL